ncbi:hypothetical protein [Shewanella sp. Shew256]|uniref:hypothetical protein n=1 Tax=Shewanella sp. Shew256 TaxID=1969376 RepID=UPI000B49A629|nr:hypothetical protein [Shewanella sp. Shew256]
MAVMPKNVKKARICDLKNMILPEMAPDQLRILGVKLEDFYPDNLADTQASNAGGIELIKLLERRTNELQRLGSELYVHKNHHSSSQIELVQQNIHVFMTQCMTLLKLASPSIPESEPYYKIIDRLVETAVYIGYYAGSNDTLALTDRYTDLGFEAYVTRTQAGGQGKASKTICLKELVIEMANCIYLDPDCVAASKENVAEAIYWIIRDFSAKGANKGISALLKFSDRHPEQHTIYNWIKTITKPVNRLKTPKPSLAVIKAKLKRSFTDKQILSKIK